MKFQFLIEKSSPRAGFEPGPQHDNLGKIVVVPKLVKEFVKQV